MANNETKVIITAVTEQADRAIRSFGQSVDGVTRQMFDMSGAAATLTGALSLTAFAGIIKSSIDAADELNNLSIKTGTSVEALAGLKYAAEQNDTSLQAVAESAKKLATNLTEKPDLFKRFGIDAKDSTGALIQLSDIFANMPDGVNKTALAVKLMGKSGEEMIPILNNGSEALRALVEEGKKYNPVTTESASRAAEFNDNLDKLKASAAGAGMAMTNDMLPGLTEISRAMAEAARESGLLTSLWVGLGGVGAAIFTDEFASTSKKIYNLKVELSGLQRQSEQVASGGLIQKLLYGSTEEVDAKIAATKKQIDELTASMNKPVNPVQEDKTGDNKGSKFHSALGGNSISDQIQKQEQQVLLSLQKQAAGYEQLSSVEKMRWDIANGEYAKFSPKAKEKLSLLAQEVDMTKAAGELEKGIAKSGLQFEAERIKAIEMDTKATLDLANARRDTLASLIDLDLQEQLRQSNLLTGMDRQQAVADVELQMAENNAQRQRDAQIAALEKQRADLEQHHAITLKMESQFATQRALIDAQYSSRVANAQKTASTQKSKSDIDMVNFGKALRQGDYENALGMAAQMTAGLAAHNRTAFEANKVFATGKAIMHAHTAIAGVLAEFPGPYGWALAAVQAAMSFAEVSAIQSTSFSGGSASGGISAGGIPSIATTPGVPVVDVTPTASASAQTTVPQEAQQQRILNLIIDTSVVGNLSQFARQIIPELNAAHADGFTLNGVAV